MPSNVYRVDKLTVLLARASMSILTTMAILLICFALIIKPYSQINAKPVDFHEITEIIFFLAGIGLFAVAMPGLFIARRHASHVQEQTKVASEQRVLQAKAAQATAYQTLFASLFADDFVEGFRLIQNLREQHAAHGSGQTLSVYAIAELNTWVKSSDPKATAVFRMLSHVENFGLLVRRGYASLDDVYFIAEGPLKHISETWGHYLEVLRAKSPDQRECEHSLWLLKIIQTYQPSGEALLQ